MAASKRHILLFIDWFEPGFKAGGPIRSVANFIAAFHKEFDISVVTTDRDLGDKEPYPGIETGEWIDRGSYRIHYTSPEHRSYRHIRNYIFESEYEILYVQSMFSLRFSFFPLWISRALTPEAKRVLAPRGMLHPGAMGFKSRKKRLFLRVFKLLRLHKDLTFQATDAQELADIRQHFGGVDTVLAPNLPRTELPALASLEKVSGRARLAYFSRISEKKGLHLLLEAIRDFETPLQVDLFGVQDEPAYWERCVALIGGLPEHIAVAYKGPVPPEEAAGTLQQYHALVLPTLGENFGHAIFEALAAGRPVIVSEHTPWRNLQAQQAGWDVSLVNAGALKGAVAELAAMGQGDWDEYAAGARALAAKYIANLDLEALRTLFEHPEQDPVS